MASHERQAAAPASASFTPHRPSCSTSSRPSPGPHAMRPCSLRPRTAVHWLQVPDSGHKHLLQRTPIYASRIALPSPLTNTLQPRIEKGTSVLRLLEMPTHPTYTPTRPPSTAARGHTVRLSGRHSDSQRPQNDPSREALEVVTSTNVPAQWLQAGDWIPVRRKTSTDPPWIFHFGEPGMEEILARARRSRSRLEIG